MRNRAIFLIIILVLCIGCGRQSNAERNKNIPKASECLQRSFARALAKKKSEPKTNTVSLFDMDIVEPKWWRERQQRRLERQQNTMVLYVGYSTGYMRMAFVDGKIICTWKK